MPAMPVTRRQLAAGEVGTLEVAAAFRAVHLTPAGSMPVSATPPDGTVVRPFLFGVAEGRRARARCRTCTSSCGRVGGARPGGTVVVEEGRARRV
jgi:hypothetical protein